MELRDLLAILKSRWKKILAGGLILAFFAYYGSVFYPVKYRSQVSVYVQKKPESSPRGDYTYDGYYALKAAEAYTDTVVGLLQSADVVGRALQISQLPATPDQVSYFTKKIRVKKTAPQVISLSVTLGGRELSAALVTAVAQATKERARLLNQEGEGDLSLNLISKDPLTLEVRPWKELNALVGFLAGGFLAGAAIILKRYFKEAAPYDP